MIRVVSGEEARERYQNLSVEEKVKNQSWTVSKGEIQRIAEHRRNYYVTHQK